MDTKIEQFLADLDSAMPEKAKIIRFLRQKILKLKPDLIETIMYGGIIFKDSKKLLWGIFARKNHITIEFGNGSILNDIYNALEGNGTKEGRRHIKIENVEDVKKKHVEEYLKQSAKIM